MDDEKNANQVPGADNFEVGLRVPNEKNDRKSNADDDGAEGQVNKKCT